MRSGRKFPVAVACSSRSWGGLEMQAVLSAEELRKRGYRVSFLAARGARAGREAQARGLSTTTLLPRGYVAPLAVLRIARHLRRGSIQLVHSEFSRDLWSLVPATRLAGGVPLILTQRMASSVNKRDPLHRYLFKNISKIIAISSAVEENLLKRTPVDKKLVVRIPNGVDLSYFHANRDAGRAVRRELGIPDSAPTAALVGRISRGKGHPSFIRAACIVARELPEARFLVVGSVTEGEEEYAEQVRSLITRVALGERLLLAGFREDIPSVLAAVDLLVIPSDSEALGNVVIEGMAASLPVAAAGRAGFRDLVVEGETGLFFSPGNPEEIAAAMGRLLRDRALRNRMGEAGRRRAERLFDREKRTDRIEELYAEVQSSFRAG